MRKTRLSYARAGAAAMFAAVLLAGCGDDETSADDPAGNDTGVETAAETPDDDATADGGSSDAGESSGDDGDDTSSDAGENVETFEITIADGEVSPPFDTYEVPLGADVRIEITSDVADELHLHGYDLELRLEPGEPGVLELTADIEGRFELETHDLGLQLLQLEVG